MILKNKRIASNTVLGFLGNIDHLVSFNRNSDHVKYLKYYQNIKGASASGKNILVTTVGLKEFVCAIYYLLMGYRVYHIIHDWVPHPGRKRVLLKIYNLISGMFFELVFHSRSQALAYGGDCTVFPLPVTRVLLNARPVNSYYLAFGRNEDYKNFAYIETLAERYPEHRFIIASKGYIPNKMAPNLTVVADYVENSELDKLISGATAVLLPYESATQSGVIISSYECCTPVIVAKLYGLVEYISPRTGSIFHLEDIQSFQRCVAEIEALSEQALISEVSDWNNIKVL